MARKRTAAQADHLILYSTNTLLSLMIAAKYYGDNHFVWCTPFFSAENAPKHVKIPPTSCPSIIYHQLWQEVKAGDRHSRQIEANRVGNTRGAAAKRKAGVITAKQEQEIASIVDGAEVADFRPLVFLIPFTGVARLVEEVPVGERAHPLSTEYRIMSLPRSLFDVIELREG